jgi:DNA-binding Lrp family transcriptional regulator
MRHSFARERGPTGSAPCRPNTPVTRKLLSLLAVNLLWGLIPWPAAALFGVYSSFFIVFSRFVFSAIVLFAATAILSAWWNRTGAERITGGTFLRYLLAKNGDFFGLPQWLYLLLIAVIGFNGQIILFFYCLKTLGAIATSIGFVLALLIAAVVNWGAGKEGMSPFKLLYLATLFLATLILGAMSPATAPSGSLGFGNLALLLVFGATYGFFFVTSSADRMSPGEYRLIRAAPRWVLVRTIFKISVIFLIASVTLPPLMVALHWADLRADLTAEAARFLRECPDWWRLGVSANGIVLIVFCTIVPTLWFYALGTSWPKQSSFDLWAGVLAMTEPMMNMVLGLFVLHEAFPLPWLLVAMALMAISILTRYLSETESQVSGVAIIDARFDRGRALMERLYALRPVRRVTSLLGAHDLMVETLCASPREWGEAIRELAYAPGLASYQALMLTRVELDRGAPDRHKGNSAKIRNARRHAAGGKEGAMPVRIASFVKVENGATAAVIAALRALPEVVRILSITGEYDIVVEFEAETPEGLCDVLVKRVEAIPGILEFRSHFVTAEWEK